MNKVTIELKLSLKLRYSYLCFKENPYYHSYSNIDAELILPPYKY